MLTIFRKGLFGVQESRQEVTKLVSLYKIAENLICLSAPYALSSTATDRFEALSLLEIQYVDVVDYCSDLPLLA